MLLETCISLEVTDQSRVSEDKSLKFVALRMHLITKLRFSLKDILSKSINSIAAAAAADASEIFSGKKNYKHLNLLLFFSINLSKINHLFDSKNSPIFIKTFDFSNYEIIITSIITPLFF